MLRRPPKPTRSYTLLPSRGLCRSRVLGLKGREVIFLEPRQVMEDRRRRRDRIAAKEHLQLCKLRPRDEPERDTFGAGQRAIEPRRRRRRIDKMLLERTREFGGLAISVARSEEHTSELQSLMRISYAVFCWNKQHR